MQKEKQLHQSVCDYIKYRYPHCLFNSDLAGSMKLTIGQATAMKRLRSNRAFPDLVLYHTNDIYHGLFLELKAEGEVLKKKNGDYKTEHLQEQHDMIVRLNNLGYQADFAIGIDQAIEQIDNYMNLI